MTTGEGLESLSHQRRDTSVTHACLCSMRWRGGNSLAKPSLAGASERHW
jgi:hypothetical protein